MLVNIELLNGSKLLQCGIFPEDVKQGDMPYTDEETIIKAFNKVP